MKIHYIFITTVLLYANDGTQDATATLNYYKNNFTSNIVNPLTSDVDFTTRDGKTFKANINCTESSKTFAKIIYTGDSDIDVTVLIDKKLNNIFSSYLVNRISGICANGIIKCNPNTWSGCKYYSFRFNGGLNLKEVNFQELSGCYCINSSCKSPSKYYKKSILGEIGGSLYNLLSNYYTSYDISIGTHDNSKVEFNAQNLKECANYKDEKPHVDKENISAKTDEMKAQQSNDESSTYYMVINSVNNQSENDYSNDLDDLKEVKKNTTVTGDTSDYSFTYNTKQKNKDGNWVMSHGDGSVQVDFTNTEAKYCEVKYLKINSQIHTDKTEHTTQNTNQESWHTDIRECTGENYTNCPYDSSIGEMIKHPCGEIDNFTEIVSQMKAMEQMSSDISCSTN